MFSQNPISKQKFTSPNHSFKFLCSGAMLSMGGRIAEQCFILQKAWDLRWWSRAAIELLWSSTYWGAFESDSLEWTALCQESHLQNTTLLWTVLEAKHTVGQIRHLLPRKASISKFEMRWVSRFCKHTVLTVSRVSVCIRFLPMAESCCLRSRLCLA